MRKVFIVLTVLFIAGLLCALGARAEKTTTVSELQTVITTIENKCVENVSSDKLLRAFIDEINRELEKNSITIKELRYFTLSADLEKDLSSLKTVLDNNIPPGAGISLDTLFQQGMEKMTASIKDEGTRFYPRGQYHAKLMEASFKGGLGMFVDEDKDRAGHFVIVETLEGYPSYESGLRSGDRILRVDGHDVQKLELHQLSELVIGEIGSKVTLTVQKKDSAEAQDIALQRVALNPNPKTIITKTFDEGIGYIKFKFLGFRMEQDTWNVLASMAKDKIKGLIIDLRDNAGYPDAAVSLTGLFLPPETPIAEDIYKDSRKLYVARNSNHFRLPLVILVNEYSASASSIMAGALRHAHRAHIVGTSSRWRFMCTEKVDLSDGSVLTVSTHYYRLPGGVVLKGRSGGVTPDTEVPQEPFTSDPEQDLQLQKALEILRGSPKTP